MNPKDITLANQWANIYRMRGFQPLPSSPTEKKPLIRYADLWDKKAPDDLFEKFPSSNVQVICGRVPWRLIVIDLDGKQAQERWDRMGRSPRTWCSHSGGGGRHLWFRLPEGLTEPISKAFLWKGDEKHEAIERLCDHSLVMAPPSIHPRTGRRYRFEDKWHSPLGMGLPADCPAWVLRLRPVVQDSFKFLLSDSDRAIRAAISTPKTMDRDEVIRSLDIIGIARSWGIKFDGKPTQKGWCPCKAFDRDDKTPSAAIHRKAGVYVDKGSGLKLSFFDLAVAIAGFPDWRSAKNALAQGRTRP
jgi:hypothetical protein